MLFSNVSASNVALSSNASVVVNSGAAVSGSLVAIETPSLLNNGTISSAVTSVDNSNGSLTLQPTTSGTWATSTGLILTATGNIDISGLFHFNLDTIHLDGANVFGGCRRQYHLRQHRWCNRNERLSSRQPDLCCRGQLQLVARQSVLIDSQRR